MSMNLELNAYSEERGRQFYEQLQERVAGMRGVESASLARNVPLANSGMRLTVQVQGHQSTPEKPINFSLNIITPSHFRTLGIPLLKGRDFGRQDTESG